MTRPVLRVMISAGEASGDRLGAGLAVALRQRDPGIDLVGMGGPQMRDAGVRLVQNYGLGKEREMQRQEPLVGRACGRQIPGPPGIVQLRAERRRHVGGDRNTAVL